jgi:hypothetical protein
LLLSLLGGIIWYTGQLFLLPSPFYTNHLSLLE